jgi:hypothetical protein
MIDRPGIQDLTQAVQRYFDLMYDGDTARFDRVFRSTAQLHGFREGQMSMWPAPQYKEILAGRPSPKSLNAPREEEILFVDFASPTQAPDRRRLADHVKGLPRRSHRSRPCDRSPRATLRAGHLIPPGLTRGVERRLEALRPITKRTMDPVAAVSLGGVDSSAAIREPYFRLFQDRRRRAKREWRQI